MKTKLIILTPFAVAALLSVTWYGSVKTTDHPDAALPLFEDFVDPRSVESNETKHRPHTESIIGYYRRDRDGYG